MVSNYVATQEGTRRHALARELIEMQVKLPKVQKTLNMFVNDAIGFRMTPEQGLFYSEYCYGTADAIAFRNDLLRIHDYKSGLTRASMKQLEVYAALFCLEYVVDPTNIEIELRIYQNDAIEVHHPEGISEVMDSIIWRDSRIRSILKG